MPALPSRAARSPSCCSTASTRPVRALPHRPTRRRRGPPASALYLCYELHYRGLAGVDDDWEWEPSLLRGARARSRTLRGGLLDARRRRRRGLAPEEMDLALRAIDEADEGTVAVAPPRARRARCEQFREFLVHRSAYQLKEADPHSWAMPRLRGPPKAAMVEIQADEYGGGAPERIHAQLFADAMDRARARRDATAPTSTAARA